MRRQQEAFAREVTRGMSCQKPPIHARKFCCKHLGAVFSMPARSAQRRGSFIQHQVRLTFFCFPQLLRQSLEDASMLCLVTVLTDPRARSMACRKQRTLLLQEEQRINLYVKPHGRLMAQSVLLGFIGIMRLAWPEQRLQHPDPEGSGS